MEKTFGEKIKDKAVELGIAAAIVVGATQQPVSFLNEIKDEIQRGNKEASAAANIIIEVLGSQTIENGRHVNMGLNTIAADLNQEGKHETAKEVLNSGVILESGATARHYDVVFNRNTVTAEDLAKTLAESQSRKKEFIAATNKTNDALQGKIVGKKVGGEMKIEQPVEVPKERTL